MYESQRIIPTYVGSTEIWDYLHIGTANHSHVCGINRVTVFNAREKCESFPRMWDQLNFIVINRSAIRIIPTYVGSTNLSKIIDL